MRRGIRIAITVAAALSPLAVTALVFLVPPTVLIDILTAVFVTGFCVALGVGTWSELGK